VPAKTADSKAKRVSVEKLVALVLAELPLPKMEGKRARIHRGFYDASRQFSGVFDELCFSTQGSAPYSKVLETILFCLGNAGLLSNLNPTFRTMSMEQEARDRILEAYRPEIGDRVPDGLVSFLAERLKPQQ